ncbi:MAG TPA: DUF1080 domain-containing protein [Planctomycetota bacterium]|nr:DUF1080 domain-containing protein [Planctomycetota bacterium]
MRRFVPSLSLAVIASAVALLLGGPTLHALRAPLSASSATTVESPRAVDPGPPGGPPSDAIVLFDGEDTSEWKGRWKVEDGALIAGGGDLVTKRAFGDVQLHLEWRTPENPKGSAENRGNSGIKLHEAYEIQILDSYGRTDVNPKRQAGSVYAQTAPLVNASRKPGEWQTYDIIFRAPYFDDAGKLVKHGTFTVLHNGVLVQDRTKILGRTNSTKPVSPEYKQPFFLQDHGAPVAFRNIWVRELERLPLEEE